MDLLNSYAIVAYIAGPVARFVDRLRDDLLPDRSHAAHITILPPRPLTAPAPVAIEFARPLVAQFEPFDVRVGSVAVFEGTQVIHLSLASGVVELVSMHDVLNTGVFKQEEMFDYSPHITLGKELTPEQFDRLLEAARSRWLEFGAAAPLRIEVVTLVQQRADKSWQDLAELGLGRVAAR